MKNICAVGVFVGSLFFGASTFAANIVLVTDNSTADAAMISTLEACGHVVTTGGNQAYDDNGALNPSTAAGLASLNLADLVIISRNTNSTVYDANVADWDSVTAPIILGSAYITRSNRWQWANTTGLQTGYSGDVAPLSTPAGWAYDGLTPGTNAFNGLPKYDLYGAGSVDLPGGSNNLLGNGQLLGVRNNVNNQRMIAAQWNAGGQTGSGNVLGGNRFFFALPANLDTGFNANGDIAFKNLVTFAIPEPSRAMLLGMGLSLLVVRRRRS